MGMDTEVPGRDPTQPRIVLRAIACRAFALSLFQLLSGGFSAAWACS